MAKLFKLIVNIIFVIFIALLVGYFILRVTDKIEIYNVKTGSMEDKIHAGDYILIFRKKSYNIGEVVTYTSDNGFITHRIIKKEGNKIITKGDANNAEDSEILQSTIVGEVIISGGILNFVILYKYVIVCVLLSLYLFSCYFGRDSKDEFELNTENKNDENIKLEITSEAVNTNENENIKSEDKEEKINEEIKEDVKEEISNAKEKGKKEDNKSEDKKENITEEVTKEVTKEVKKEISETKETDKKEDIKSDKVVTKRKTKKEKNNK